MRSWKLDGMLHQIAKMVTRRVIWCDRVLPLYAHDQITHSVSGSHFVLYGVYYFRMFAKYYVRNVIQPGIRAVCVMELQARIVSPASAVYRSVERLIAVTRTGTCQVNIIQSFICCKKSTVTILLRQLTM